MIYEIEHHNHPHKLFRGISVLVMSDSACTYPYLPFNGDKAMPVSFDTDLALFRCNMGEMLIC
jgi:hypothetical protein